MIDPVQKMEKRSNGTLRVYTVNNQPTMTQQQYAAECDINNIMKKHENPERFMNSIQITGQYADFSQITDYQDMLNTVRYADNAFSSLPAELRLRFKNDPGNLLDFLQDPKNYDEGVKLGLVNKKVIPDPILKNDDSNDENNKGSKNKTKKTDTE